ncbi:hypothetical protein NECID01_0829 [Nematocida sp. AWRm77]|nr:hypothetical protein NECID01_0829 [Nematocida sp. AWRm77]
MDSRQRTTEKRIFVLVFVVVVLGCAYLSYVYGPELLSPSKNKEQSLVKLSTGARRESEHPATEEILEKKNSSDGKGSSDEDTLDQQKPPNKEEPGLEDSQKRTPSPAQTETSELSSPVLKGTDDALVDAGSSRKDKDSESSSKDKEAEKDGGVETDGGAKADAGVEEDTEAEPETEKNAEKDTGVDVDANAKTNEDSGEEIDTDKNNTSKDQKTSKDQEENLNSTDNNTDPSTDYATNPSTDSGNSIDSKTSAAQSAKLEESSSGNGLGSVDTEKESSYRKERSNAMQFLKEIGIDAMKKDKLIRAQGTKNKPSKISLVHNEETDRLTLSLNPAGNSLAEIEECIDNSSIDLYFSTFACIVVQVPSFPSVSKKSVECISKSVFKTGILNNLSCTTLHIKNIDSLPRDKDLKNSGQCQNPTFGLQKNSSRASLSSNSRSSSSLRVCDTGDNGKSKGKSKNKGKPAPTRLILTNVGPSAFNDIVASIDISKVEILEIIRSSLKKSEGQASGLQFSSLTSLFLSDIDLLEIIPLSSFLSSSTALSALGLVNIKISSYNLKTLRYKKLIGLFSKTSKPVVTLSCDLYKLLLDDKELGFSSKTFTSLILYATEEELDSLCASDSSSPKPSDEMLKADNLVVFVWARVKNSSSEALKSHASKIDTEQFAANIQVKALKSFEVLLVGINVGMGERIEERLLDKFVPNIEENASTSTQKLETLKGIWGLDPTAQCVLSIYLFSPS